MNLKYFDAFSGYGGFSLGIQQAYEDLSKTERKQQGWDEKNSTDAESQFLGTQQSSCVGFSEVNKYAIQVYEKHFPSHKNFGDITEIDPATLPDFDLFCGGFPCQSFSIAGKRGGFNDTRGTLFFDIMRIVRIKRPRFILLENVKGLLSHDGGLTFDTIIRTIDELGYDIQWQVLNSKNFGVPQNRERVFIIGHTRGTPRPKVFPIRKIDEENIILPTITTRITADSNGTFVRKGQTPKQVIGGSQGNRVYDPSGISTTISSQAGGRGAKTGLYMVDDPSRKKGFNKKNTAPTLRSESHGNNPVVAIPVLTPDRPNKRQNGRRFKEDGEPSFTLTGQDKHGVYDGMKIRRLTPTEASRLMGLPDYWFDIKGLSDSQKYKLAGNGVVVPVVKEIIKRLLTNSQKGV